MMFSHKLYFGSLFAIYVVYGLVFVGILSTVPHYVYIWNGFVQLGLCLFLMFRFHPFRKQYTMTIYDVKMIFGASTLLLLNTITLPVALSKILNKIQSNTQQIVRRVVPIQDDQNDQDDDTLQSNTSSYTNMIMDSLHLWSVAEKIVHLLRYPYKSSTFRNLFHRFSINIRTCTS